MQFVRRGSGAPLLLVHGLGNTRRAWDPVIPLLEQRRELVIVDLPGHGASPAEEDSGSGAGLARSLERFIVTHGFGGVDMVGASLGGRLVLEIARRGLGKRIVALDPSGFIRGWERSYVAASLIGAITMLRGVRPAIGPLAHAAPARTAMLLQLSARPWALDPDLIAHELAAIARTPHAQSLVLNQAWGPPQEGSAEAGPRVTIGWGRHDRLLLPQQAGRALAAFPGAALHWFDGSGHFPGWDEPQEVARLILGTAATMKKGAEEGPPRPVSVSSRPDQA